MEFVISKASTEEFGAVTHFLQEYFLKEVPLNAMFSLEGEDLPVIPDVADFILKAEDNQGKLVGVAFNTSKPTLLWDREKSPKQKQVVEFFEFFESDGKLQELSPGLVEVWLMAVHPDWRRQGVGRALVEASERQARAAGFGLISITGVSEYTSMLARRLGWRLHYSIDYKDYPRLSGRNAHLKPNHPHKALSYYIKKL